MPSIPVHTRFSAVLALGIHAIAILLNKLSSEGIFLLPSLLVLDASGSLLSALWLSALASGLLLSAMPFYLMFALLFRPLTRALKALKVWVLMLCSRCTATSAPLKEALALSMFLFYRSGAARAIALNQPANLSTTSVVEPQGAGSEDTSKLNDGHCFSRWQTRIEFQDIAYMQACVGRKMKFVGSSNRTSTQSPARGLWRRGVPSRPSRGRL